MPVNSNVEILRSQRIEAAAGELVRNKTLNHEDTLVFQFKSRTEYILVALKLKRIIVRVT